MGQCQQLYARGNVLLRKFHYVFYGCESEIVYSTAAKGYDCACCDKSTKIGTLVVVYI